MKKKRKKLVKLDKNFIKDYDAWIPKVSFKKVEQNSWFNIDKSITYSRRGILHKEKLNTTYITASKDIILPNLEQKEILLEWMELYRLVYNLTISYIKQSNLYNESFYNLRNLIRKDITKLNKLKKLNERINKSKIPKHTIDNAINDVVKAIKTAKTLKNKGFIRRFKLRYKRQSSNKICLVLEKGAFSKDKKGFCKSVLGEMKSDQKDIFKKVNSDCRLTYNKLNKRFILHIPITWNRTGNLSRYNYISLDPGCRKFLVGYSEDGMSYKICSRNYNKNNIEVMLDKIVEASNLKKFSNCKNPLKASKKYQNRLRQKITNKVDDLHWKVCKQLCTSYNNILVGDMSTASVIKKGGNMTKKCKRYLQALSLFKFKTRLLNKAKEYNCNIISVDESYTSKTCCKCGEINPSTPNETFKCNFCNFTTDRDVNGAINIFLKHKSL